MTSSVCVLCSQSESIFAFARGEARIVRCAGCELLRREPAAPFEPNTVLAENESRPELLASQRYVRCIAEQGLQGAKILYAGLSQRDLFATLLAEAGHSVTYFDHTSISENSAEAEEEFDCLVLYQTLERTPDPYELLRQMRKRLRADGHLMLVGLSMDSLPARRFGRRWIGWSAGLNHYFNRATLQLLLEKAGFERILLAPDKRHYTIEHARSQISRLPEQQPRRLLWSMLAMLPKSIQQKEVQLESSAVVVMSRKTEVLGRNKLSVIMPVFNEKRTFMDSFTKVNQRVQEGIAGVDQVEIIIVESNSTDGSRELVHSVVNDNVRLVLEEKPQGKGHAVRTGLKHATGEICIIQDADLEYDVYDYDALIKPLVEYRQTFVLGTRHSGNWKIRKFAGEAVMAFVCNFGHILFTTIINVFCGQNLTDPFTMYKVFRRECIYKLKFECNRFDFDHELLIKLVKKGYRPIEIPVNYNARGFAEGKKIAVIRDPITWIIADFKYFFASPFDDDYLIKNSALFSIEAKNSAADFPNSSG
ncbi:MAG: glycosyltransferase [Candidatus Melainabacteria bacterium]|nr:MAG: glycosyltransferase [Candidatus Melainabacteria bacterium]